MRPITMGLCLPADCPEADLRLMLETSASSAAVLKTFREVPNSNYNFYLEPVGITLM